MSVEVQVYLDPQKMPSPEQWQAAIRERGFDVMIDTDFDPWEHTGFLPGEYDGEEAGFEYFAGRLSADETRRAGVPAGLSACIDLVTHGDEAEWYSSIIAGAVLAEMTQGIFDQTDADDGRWGPEDAVWYARKLLTWEEDHADDDSDSESEEDYEGRTPLDRPSLSFARNVRRAAARRPAPPPPAAPRERAPAPEPAKKPWWKLW